MNDAKAKKVLDAEDQLRITKALWDKFIGTGRTKTTPDYLVATHN